MAAYLSICIQCYAPALYLQCKMFLFLYSVFGNKIIKTYYTCASS